MKELFTLEINRPPVVISDLVYEGEVMLLAGRPKVGKSRLVNQMAVSLSTGTPFLGMAVPEPKRVLVIDLENRPWAIRERFSLMTSASPAENVFIWCSETLSKCPINLGDEGIMEIERLLDSTMAQVLIIDPWRLLLGRDENDATEIVKGLRILSGLRKNHPALAIVIVHHVRKERFDVPTQLRKNASSWVENISGHFALVGHVDSCFGLEREDHEGEEIVVFSGAARNVQPRTILLSDDPDSLRFDVLATEEHARLAMTPGEWELWQVAKQKKQFTWSSLLAESGTKTKKLLSSMLKKAEAHHLIECHGKMYTVVSTA